MAFESRFAKHMMAGALAGSVTLAAALGSACANDNPVLAGVSGSESVIAARSGEPGSPGAKPTGLVTGRIFKDCPECPEMVVVPAGHFALGSPDSEAKRGNDEGPQHRVRISKPFAVGRFEITFAEWDACVEAGGCGGYRPRDEDWGHGRQPVIQVSWYKIKLYLAWLSQRTGHTYRLLSEAEWEYVARAGTSTAFSTGVRLQPDHAHFDGTEIYNGSTREATVRLQTQPVGGHAPNAFGLHDVHGNVWEWVEDCWNKSYAGAPSDGAAWTGPDCRLRVVRGGSWFDPPANLRSANRNAYPPIHDADYLGFRVAREL